MIEYFDHKFSKLERNLSKVATRDEMNERFAEFATRDEMNERFAEFATRDEMNERFALIDKRFVEIDKRFQKIDYQFSLLLKFFYVKEETYSKEELDKYRNTFFERLTAYDENIERINNLSQEVKMVINRMNRLEEKVK